jgi:hypothetical protein
LLRFLYALILRLEYIMINLLSIRCSLAFAPYILESAESFLRTGDTTSRVIRQAANGFIMRSEDALLLRHQNREAALGREEVRHYLATVRLRSGFYDVARKSDEVILANVGKNLLLSHPQSEMWIDAQTIPSLLAAFKGQVIADDETLPEWLNLSGGDGRLLLSDQRNGRWVLLGSDHFTEFEKRHQLLESSIELPKAMKPPTILLKGLNIHLQTAFKLAATFEEFADTGAFIAFEEFTPTYQLTVMRATEGMKISDGNLLVAVTAKEARKWAAILGAELEKYQAKEFVRGSIKTVLATTEQGLWVLQWGDEILLSNDDLQNIKTVQGDEIQTKRLVIKRDGDFLLVLEKSNGNCVALIEEIGVL